MATEQLQTRRAVINGGWHRARTGQPGCVFSLPGQGIIRIRTKIVPHNPSPIGKHAAEAITLGRASPERFPRKMAERQGAFSSLAGISLQQNFPGNTVRMYTYGILPISFVVRIKNQPRTIVTGT
ncbi:hypothetical protein DFH08DRAFT_808206 [Mycena albidolilacea]|uniref:Uncharacterized protein n=1 Tax=Mycena albidolilacea TaxID=1033008 RepID=A0AAD7A3Z7_9AGAR|nr:hypothetical protein DFH08DRAFT_808206 [Mycena albidolilacea]